MSEHQYLKTAYEQGIFARESGWERVSPYQRMKAEQYWHAGYDNVDFTEFDKFVKESRRAVKSKLGYARIGLGNV